MIGFILFAMVFYIIGLFFLIVIGGKDLRNKRVNLSSSLPSKWPLACVIVPAAGPAPELVQSVRSLLSQDYPECRIVFVTRDLDDPATCIIKEEIKADFRARLVHAGRTSECGQKNMNLLRGLEEAEENTEVFVFCDATRIAEPDWLKSLIKPVANGDALVTSGYHHIIPGDHRVASLVRTCAVLILFAAKGFPFFNQPWGGATAIRREAFEALDVGKLWSQNVVDDVSLAALLKKRAIQTASSAQAILSTPVSGVTWKDLNHWLARQWLYLKFCFPGMWLAAGGICYMGAVLVILSFLLCVLGVFGVVSFVPALASALLLVMLTGLGWFMRKHHPSPGPILPWLAAFFATLEMAGWSHLETLFTMHIVWKNIRYDVEWGGDVTGIQDFGY